MSHFTINFMLFNFAGITRSNIKLEEKEKDSDDKILEEEETKSEDVLEESLNKASEDSQLLQGGFQLEFTSISRVYKSHDLL